MATTMRISLDETEVQLLQLMVMDSSNVTHTDPVVRKGMQELAGRIDLAINSQCSHLLRRDLDTGEF